MAGYRYLVYEKATGTILYTGVCNPANLAGRKATETLGVLACPEGVSDQTHHVESVGGVVEVVEN